jgi:hypothetical protein
LQGYGVQRAAAVVVCVQPGPRGVVWVLRVWRVSALAADYDLPQSFCGLPVVARASVVVLPLVFSVWRFVVAFSFY